MIPSPEKPRSLYMWPPGCSHGSVSPTSSVEKESCYPYRGFRENNAMKGSLVSLGFLEIMISCQTLTVKMNCILINDFYSVKKINDQSVCLYMQSCIFYMYMCVSPLCLCVHTQSEEPAVSAIYIWGWVGNTVSSVERR